MLSSLSLRTSQVQPEPKLATACAAKSLRKRSRVVHLCCMSCSSSEEGSDLKGLMQCQKKEWFQCWAALFKILGSWHLSGRRGTS